jgi:hypothetical protein
MTRANTDEKQKKGFSIWLDGIYLDTKVGYSKEAMWNRALKRAGWDPEQVPDHLKRSRYDIYEIFEVGS